MQFSVQNFWYFTRAKHSKDDKSTHFSLNPPQPNFVSITETRSFAASITDLFHAFQTHERETWHLRCCEQPCWWRWQDIDMFLWADSRLSCRRNKHRLLFKMTPILPEMISTERDRTVCELQLACLQLGTSQTPVTSNSFTSLLLLQRCGENTCLLTGPHCPPPPPPDDTRMKMENWWNDTDWVELKDSGKKKLCLYHSTHRKSHTDSPGYKPREWPPEIRHSLPEAL
jgi:hypothetical protein